MKKEIVPNQVLLIWHEDRVTWDGLPMYLPLYGFVENNWIATQIINEKIIAFMAEIKG